VRTKTKGEVRLDDNETRFSGAWRAMSLAWVHGSPRVEELALPKSLKSWQLHPRQGCHPVDVGILLLA
jgi:hypothetical protein